MFGYILLLNYLEFWLYWADLQKKCWNMRFTILGQILFFKTAWKNIVLMYFLKFLQCLTGLIQFKNKSLMFKELGKLNFLNLNSQRQVKLVWLFHLWGHFNFKHAKGKCQKSNVETKGNEVEIYYIKMNLSSFSNSVIHLLTVIHLEEKS